MAVTVRRHSRPQQSAAHRERRRGTTDVHVRHYLVAAGVDPRDGAGVLISNPHRSRGGPPVRLTIQDTAVTGDSLTGSHGVKAQGGGLFTARPATVILTDSEIALNIPDQCVGC